LRTCGEGGIKTDKSVISKIQKNQIIREVFSGLECIALEMGSLLKRRLNLDLSRLCFLSFGRWLLEHGGIDCQKEDMSIISLEVDNDHINGSPNLSILPGIY
jgi:hypothetical protein